LLDAGNEVPVIHALQPEFGSIDAGYRPVSLNVHQQLLDDRVQFVRHISLIAENLLHVNANQM